MTVSLWGHSPALDLQQLIEDSAPTSVSEMTSVNVLLAGAGDVRHVVRTLAQMYRHPFARRVHIHVLEPSVEAAARQLLLLTLALEPSEVLGPLHKARAFLEIHGNTLLRPNTLQYVRHKANQLIYMVTDPNYLKSRLPLVSLDYLKYKERDYLEGVYKFWRNSTQQEFDIVNFWDSRLRASLGVRYDSRQGLFDWDYHMKMNSSVEGGTPITTQEYIGWRETGVAYRWPETECTDVNVTLASGTISPHTFGMCNYLGEQLTGPYVSYGLECEDEDMLKKYNNQFMKSSTEIAERNVTRFMYELAYRKPYEADAEQENGGASVMQETPLRSRELEAPTMFAPREEYSPLIVDDASVTFLSPGTLEEERPSARFRGSFQVIVLGQSLLPQILAPPLLGMAADEALLLIEGRQFVVGPRRCELQEFNEKMQDAAVEAKLEPVPPDAEFDPAHESLLKYIFHRR